MKNSKHRERARIVGILDLALKCVLLVVLTVFCVIATSSGEEDTEIVRYVPRKSSPVWPNWSLFIVLLGCLTLQIFSAYRLIRATDISVDPKTARKQANFWDKVTIPYILFSTRSLLANQTWVALGANLLIHFGFCWVVWQFIFELNAVLKKVDTDSSQGQGQVRNDDSSV